MMSTWQPHVSRETELVRVDQLLGTSPDNVELCFHRAVILRELGRTEEAKQAYLTLLAGAPTHFGALNNLGALAMETGFKTAARTAYAEAVKHHPKNPMGHVNLANTLAIHKEEEAALKHFQIAIQLAPDHPEAHQGLSRLLADQGRHEAARIHRIKGFQKRSILTLPYRGQARPIELLVLASADGGAVPIWHHLDDQRFLTTILFVDFFDPKTPLPSHQLVFNAIGDADLATHSLEQASKLIRQTTAPIINQPEIVMATGRMSNVQRLRDIPGVITPAIHLLPRESLMSNDAGELLSKYGFQFPLLLRSPGYHNGQFFMRVDNDQSLTGIASNIPGPELMAIQFLDSRQADGKIRKYRVMMIDGKIYPLHVAVSHDWKIHFVTAEMANDPENRSEDAAFLNQMPHVLGPQAMNALKNIQTKLGLDYAGIDFGLNTNCEILLFEANATMVVNPPDADQKWDYRRPAVSRILEALRQLLLRHANQDCSAAHRRKIEVEPPAD